MTIGGRPATSLACLLLALAATARAGEPAPKPTLEAPDAATLRAFDRPSDGGSTVAVEWGLSPADHPAHAYIVEIASEPDAKAGTFKKAAEIPANAKLKADAPKYFGFRSHHRELHYVGIEPAAFYKPDKQALRRKVVADESRWMRKPWDPDADYLQRLATLAAATAACTDGVKSLAQSAAAPDAQKAVEPYIASLEALLKALDKTTTSLGADDRPVIADASYMKTLDAIDESIHAALRANDDYRRALREASPGQLAALDEAERGFRLNLRRYRACAARLRKFETRVAKQLAKREKKERQRINGQSYAFRVAITDGDRTLYIGDAGSPKVALSRAHVNYFKGYKVNNLVYSLTFCSIVMLFLQMARRNPNLYIRKIAGLEAVEEAIGRATEMGRSAFFVHGLTGVGSLSTIASLNILGRVARRAAEYDTRVLVMNRDPIVMAVSQEVVKQSYTEAGRPDAYSDDDVALVASDQFSYVAAVGGRMVRERPAAIFLMGYFFAESLLLAETGASTGAIQIAGTDSYTQIPFFITTCDYTLIGEELYAASAYLSREPKMLGSLRGQDVGKAVLMAVMLLFTGLASAAAFLAVKAPGFQALIDYWVKTLCQPFS